jgi:glycosyltransferase involved in cell wall biosynthesis
MKVGLIIDELAPGSTPKLLGCPIPALRELGIEAEIIAIIDKGHRHRHRSHYDEYLQDVKVRYLFTKFPRWIKKINFKFPGMSFFSLHHIASVFFAHRSIKQGEFDILVANCQYSTFAALNIKIVRGIPFLTLIWDPSTYTARKIYRNRWGWKFPLLFVASALLDRFAFLFCRAVITSGRYHHRALRRITAKPLELLYPGCFPCARLPDFSLRKPMILAYDRWDIGNIPDIFLDILKRVNDPRVTLTIGGFWHPQFLRESFLSKVKACGMQSRVDLLGPLNEGDIIRLCCSAWVHIHPVHEAFGMQTLEAAGCGCPVIIPGGSGVTDLFVHGVHGFFPRTGDLDELCNYVNELFCDPSAAAHMGVRAWQRAKQYTWRYYAEQYSGILRRYAHAQN